MNGQKTFQRPDNVVYKILSDKYVCYQLNLLYKVIDGKKECERGYRKASKAGSYEKNQILRRKKERLLLNCVIFGRWVTALENSCSIFIRTNKICYNSILIKAHPMNKMNAYVSFPFTLVNAMYLLRLLWCEIRGTNLSVNQLFYSSLNENDSCISIISFLFYNGLQQLVHIFY